VLFSGGLGKGGTRSAGQDARLYGRQDARRYGGWWKAFRLLSTLCLLLLLPRSSLAHDPGLSTLTLQFKGGTLTATLVMSLRDANSIVEVDKDRDLHITAAELAAAQAEMQLEATNALEVSFDDHLAQASNARCEFDEKDNATVWLTFPAPAFSSLTVRSRWLAQLPPGHRQFFSLQKASGETLAERLLAASADSVTIRLDVPLGSTAATPARTQTFADFLVLGIKHIWTGYDHLLFLFGLLIVTRNFTSAFTIITCFTIAHSITLAVATLSLVRFSSRVVEPLIAVSIVYVGVENLLRGDDPKGRWLLTLGFGLVHGFGFASVLRELGVGANGTGIAMPLLSFNLGVEVGQVVVAALLLPVIWKLRVRPQFVKRWVPACSTAVALLGTFWFVQRVWFTP
jgi:hydrogenase/urease accessory protein HupE